MFIRVSILALAASCSVAMSGFSDLSSTTPGTCAAVREQAAQVQSVSGRITSVSGNTFTLQPEASQDPSGRGAQEALTFTIDQDTVVEGKIAVGSKADITYRRQDGNNIAVSIRVSTQS